MSTTEDKISNELCVMIAAFAELDDAATYRHVVLANGNGEELARSVFTIERIETNIEAANGPADPWVATAHILGIGTQGRGQTIEMALLDLRAALLKKLRGIKEYSQKRIEEEQTRLTALRKIIADE